MLVHGGWSGAHGWRSVRRHLAADGHEVYTPSLTGIGERVHLSSPQIDLTTHVHDVVNHMVFEDLLDAVVVAYSYGGAVVTAAIEHVHGRIRELVYLDAFVPRDGMSIAAMSGRETADLVGLGADWLVAPPDRAYDEPEEAAWQIPRRVAHPVRCFTERIRIAKPVEEYAFGLTYIKAIADSREAPGGNAFWDMAEHASASNRWRYEEISTTHMIASNRPAELANLLARISAGCA